MTRPRIATVSLAGCFGCHMSILDLDQRLLELVERVDLDQSPFDDLKRISGRCAVGLVEGGCGTMANVRQLRHFRAHCDLLVALGECAICGGLPALRNAVPLRECLAEAYLDGPGVVNPAGRPPRDRELPRLLDRVYPCHEVVRMDYHLPGCPPSADAIWRTLTALLAGQPVELPYELIKYD